MRLHILIGMIVRILSLLACEDLTKQTKAVLDLKPITVIKLVMFHVPSMGVGRGGGIPLYKLYLYVRCQRDMSYKRLFHTLHKCCTHTFQLYCS